MRPLPALASTPRACGHSPHSRRRLHHECVAYVALSVVSCVRSPRPRRRLHHQRVRRLALNAASRAAAPRARVAEAGDASRFSVTFVAAVALCLGGLGQCVQKCFSLDNKPKENDMSKRGRKRRDRRKNGANHGKRPNA